ncbi:GntR family transcriptional regulator [Streptomyces sp. 3211]|uniref:GntR family transcriptional regulator n=1 Tax=Streptomyces sp. 3211 TaxID=1964449 RepID=UPI0009A4CC8A|nr:GntR family transcriptional regulator [Streptomyces sp. 3211]
MTLPLDEDPRPPYLQAAEVLRAAILSGELQPGEQLPSARRLQERFGVASSTVQNALRVLRQEGLVFSVLGRGSYVTLPLEVPGSEGREVDREAEDDQLPPGWRSARSEDSRPPFIRTADTLREEIREGIFPPGSQLPSARELQERFSIANSTAQNALRLLKSEGLIYAVKGRGVFVRNEPTSDKQYEPKVVQFLLREEVERQARSAASEFAHLSDAELKTLAEQFRDELSQAREAYQAAASKGQKITKELARRGQLAPPLHDDRAAARKELEAKLSEAKKRR